MKVEIQGLEWTQLWLPTIGWHSIMSIQHHMRQQPPEKWGLYSCHFCAVAGYVWMQKAKFTFVSGKKNLVKCVLMSLCWCLLWWFGHCCSNISTISIYLTLYQPGGATQIQQNRTNLLLLMHHWSLWTLSSSFAFFSVYLTSAKIKIMYNDSWMSDSQLSLHLCK